MHLPTMEDLSLILFVLFNWSTTIVSMKSRCSRTHRPPTPSNKFRRKCSPSASTPGDRKRQCMKASPWSLFQSPPPKTKQLLQQPDRGAKALFSPTVSPTTPWLPTKKQSTRAKPATVSPGTNMIVDTQEGNSTPAADDDHRKKLFSLPDARADIQNQVDEAVKPAVTRDPDAILALDPDTIAPRSGRVRLQQRD